MYEDGKKEIVIVQNAGAINARFQENASQHYTNKYVNTDAQMRQSL